jgi:hypothetical protein
MFNRAFNVSLVLAVIVISAWCANSAGAQAFVTDGLLGFWTLDKSDIDGGTVKDVFGENDGKIEGDPQTVEGVIEEGMEFDGSQDRVEIAKDLMVDLESFTIECWFNYENSANWRWMVGGGPEWNYGLGMCIYSGSNIVRYHLKTDGGSFYDGNGSTALDPGDWYHIAYTYDGETTKSYVNGEVDFERALSGVVQIDPTTLAIGGGYWNNGEYFVGILDEVRIYDRALDEDEVEQNYNVTSNSMAVDAMGKLIAVWGKVKSDASLGY